MRKRGDLRFRDVAVDHAGSGLWVRAHLSAGKGAGIVDLELALDSIGETAEQTGLPQDRVLVVADGDYGNVPYFGSWGEPSLACITGLNRPKLYEDPGMLQRPCESDWTAVPDSRSGPQRFGAEIGTMKVHPGKRTWRADGSRHEPVSVRVVARRTVGHSSHHSSFHLPGTIRLDESGREQPRSPLGPLMDETHAFREGTNAPLGNEMWVREHFGDAEPATRS